MLKSHNSPPKARRVVHSDPRFDNTILVSIDWSCECVTCRAQKTRPPPLFPIRQTAIVSRWRAPGMEDAIPSSRLLLSSRCRRSRSRVLHRTSHALLPLTPRHDDLSKAYPAQPDALFSDAIDALIKWHWQAARRLPPITTPASGSTRALPDVHRPHLAPANAGAKFTRDFFALINSLAQPRYGHPRPCPGTLC